MNFDIKHLALKGADYICTTFYLSTFSKVGAIAILFDIFTVQYILVLRNILGSSKNLALGISIEDEKRVTPSYMLLLVFLYNNLCRSRYKYCIGIS